MLKEREDLLSQISGNTLRYRIKQWVDNYKDNLPYIHGGRGVAGLSNMLAGLPSVVVGSGPTLDRNIKDLPLLKNKALVIACDSAVKALESFGVEPDIIMVTDSKERVAEFLRGLDVAKYSFVCDTFIHPATTELLQNAKRLYWYSTLPIESCPFTGALNDWSGFVGNLGTGGCVATTAWWMASRLMQSDPTLMVGLPQAFYDPAQMYSNEVTKTVDTEPYTSNFIKTYDIFGDACYTFPALQSFAWWFQDAFLQIPGIHINCSEGGIVHENCLNMPLLAAIQKYLVMDFDPKEILFAKENIIETMFERGGDSVSHLKEHRHLLEIILDGPSLTNLGLRMGRTEKTFNEIVDIVTDLRSGGFIIEETESQTVAPDGTPGVIAQVFTLRGLETTGDDQVKMGVEITEGRPMLLEMRELNLDPDHQAMIDKMSRGLPPLTIAELGGLVFEEADAAGVEAILDSLIEKDLVMKVTAQPGMDAEELYVAKHLLEETPITVNQPATLPAPIEQVDPGRYSDMATDPSITQKALDRLSKKWFPNQDQDTSVAPIIEDGSVYVASDVPVLQTRRGSLPAGVSVVTPDESLNIKADDSHLGENDGASN